MYLFWVQHNNILLVKYRRKFSVIGPWSSHLYIKFKIKLNNKTLLSLAENNYIFIVFQNITNFNTQRLIKYFRKGPHNHLTLSVILHQKKCTKDTKHFPCYLLKVCTNKYTNGLLYIKQHTVDNTESSAYNFNLFNDAVSNSEQRISRITVKLIWMNGGVENYWSNISWHFIGESEEDKEEMSQCSRCTDRKSNWLYCEHKSKY